MTNYKTILRLHSQGMSTRSIAASLGCSKNTVRSVLKRLNSLKLLADNLSEQTNIEIGKLLFPERVHDSERLIPDCESLHKELAKSGVTLSLLWSEYCDQARLTNEVPYMYTQFCKIYRDYASQHKATMHIHRKPGELMEVDWAGKTATVLDDITGEKLKAYIFVATLASSGYSYVEAFLSMEMENWIAAHIHAFAYFEGVPKTIICDNLKTGVKKTNRYEPILTRNYQELAEHYQTAIIPARVRKPKDKSSVEGTVGVISTWIIAALRNRQFFSLGELNEAVFEKLDEFNVKPFQKKKGSRLTVFDDEEKIHLIQLPATPYEIATWKVATVQFNYHITVHKMHYSVPYEYIKQKVDVRITSNVIEIFFHNHRIASHMRLKGRPGQYSTITEHMPENHQKYLYWNSERFIQWAEKIGPSVSIVVKAILDSHKVEQQGYRSCMALIKLTDKYSINRLENACAKVLSYTPRPTYKNVQTVLKTGTDKLMEKQKPKKKKVESDYGFTRGAAYYKGGDK
jgi:transposase